MAKTKSKKMKTKSRKSALSFLADDSLGNFIKSLKISSEQEKFLLDELPQMDTKERLDLLEALTNVYTLNQEESRAIENLRANWQ